ncbi:hypothetical protein AXX17_AT3G50570 [Arabidopsis thaliana]|uniref:Uncharacterized protein n=1 Tax=Arabidopsis thaliana TaxID=3702 RepID=A0A178VIG7_ARATH|nr:hypothetical protein AXX17_AT3G50570 [Arabidopsis thaliana]
MLALPEAPPSVYGCGPPYSREAFQSTADLKAVNRVEISQKITLDVPLMMSF